MKLPLRSRYSRTTAIVAAALMVPLLLTGCKNSEVPPSPPIPGGPPGTDDVATPSATSADDPTTTTPSTTKTAAPKIILKLGTTNQECITLQDALNRNKDGDYFEGTSKIFQRHCGQKTMSGLQKFRTKSESHNVGGIEVGNSEWRQLLAERLSKDEAIAREAKATADAKAKADKEAKDATTKATVLAKSLPSSIDLRSIEGALQGHNVIDANKQTKMLYYLEAAKVIDKATHKETIKVLVTVKAPTSFGGHNKDGTYSTPNGVMAICRIGLKHVDPAKYRSNQYFLDKAKTIGAPMPYPVFFENPGTHSCSGVSVHQDPLGNSHKCVHLARLANARYIYTHSHLGDWVVVHGTKS